MQSIVASDFFATGIDKLNDNFAELQTIAQTLRASDNDSGLAAPVLMSMGADNQHWVLPSNLSGPYVVFDNKLILREDQFDEVNGEVVLGYAPSAPYDIRVAWSTTRSGITKPVRLTQHPTKGNQYWMLPEGYGPNVLAVDQGRFLDRDSYRIENDTLVLDYAPQAGGDGTPEISACWGAGGPGMTAPVYLEKSNVDPLDITHFTIPLSARNQTLLIQDHGLTLAAADYVVDNTTGILSLNYVPAEPLKISGSWGFTMDGLYMESVGTSMDPDGVETEFVLAQEPQIGTILVKTVDNTTKAETHYNLYDDFVVDGRRLRFINGVVPASNTKIVVSMMTSVFTSQKSLTSNAGAVVADASVYLLTNTLVEEVTENPDGTLQQVLLKDNGVVVMTIDFTYNADGTLATRVEQAAGQTTTRTYNYDAGGKLLNVTKTVA